MRIETERLLLRPMQLDDLDELVELSTYPEVRRFLISLDRERGLQRIQQDQRDWQVRGYGLVAIIDRRSGRLLGRSGFRYWPEFEETELGWALAPDVWGRGYATEAALACATWGFQTLDIPYFTAMIRPVNDRSIRVAERLGMSPLREDVVLGESAIVYALTREAWEEREAQSRADWETGSRADR